MAGFEVEKTQNTNQMNEITLVNQQNLTTARKVDSIVKEVLSTASEGAFVQTHVRASAIVAIEGLLTKEYMEPIMALMGKAIGFRTDKDNETGKYNMETVRRCLMEAMFAGIQPIGNQFNIIASRMYPTKEGFSHLLKNVNGLWFDIIQQVPKIDGGQAVVDTVIKWSVNGGEKMERIMHLPVKVNEKMGADAILGKAERKAKKWLYTHLTGVNLPDGDISDLDTGIKAANGQASKPQTSNNEHIEEVELVEDQAPKEKTELEIRAESFVMGSETLEILEKRILIAKKQCPNLSDNIYNETKKSLQG